MVSTRSKRATLKGTLSSEQEKVVAQPDETKEEEPSGGKKADLLDSDVDSDSDGLDGLDAGVEDGYTAAAGECAAFDETDSDEEELPIEAKARELDAESAREAAQDAEELRQQQAGMLAPKEEDNVDEVVGLVGIDGSEGSVPSEQLDLEAMLQRIHDTVRQIENFKSLPPEKKRETPRSVLQQKLVDDCATYYGYLPFLISKFFDIFTPSQTLEFLNANETDRPVTIRTNTLKTRRKDLQQSLQARGMRLEAMDKWSKVGMVVYQSPVPIGATPEYLAGHYIIQSAASLLPVMALAPAANERVLDMCAAPGGKTSHISALMKNTGVVFANDLKRERLRALNANLHRLGAHNAVVTSYDGRRYPSVLRGFDRALLDAPCTGLGVIAKDPGVKLTRDEAQLAKLSHLQRELLVAAVDCVDADSPTGGVIIYSTCSVSVEENEAVVDYILKKRHVKLEPTGLAFGVPGFTRWREHRFHPSMALVRRFYPHTHNMDGFFVSRLRKLSNTKPGDEEEKTFGKLTKKQKLKRQQVEAAAIAAEEGGGQAAGQQIMAQEDVGTVDDIQGGTQKKKRVRKRDYDPAYQQAREARRKAYAAAAAAGSARAAKEPEDSRGASAARAGGHDDDDDGGDGNDVAPSLTSTKPKKHKKQKQQAKQSYQQSTASQLSAIKHTKQPKAKNKAAATEEKPAAKQELPATKAVKKKSKGRKKKRKSKLVTVVE